MKYVIFEYNTFYMPVIIPNHVTHSQVSVEDATPISAGFYTANGYGEIKLHGKSDSLKLKPHPRDSKLIGGALADMGTSYFLKHNHE